MPEAALDRYLEQATIDRIRREWEAKGFQVIKESVPARTQPDLLMRRGEEKVAFEVTTASALQKRRKAISQMAKTFADDPNTTFRLVVANPPRERSIEVDGLDNILLSYIIENFPDELDELSSHTLVESVDDVEVSAVDIDRGRIRVSGRGVVSVRLEYGSASDQEHDIGYASDDSFPFEFDITLDSNLEIVDVDHLEVDTSSFDA